MKLVMKFGGTGINSGTKISYVANLIKNHRLNTHDDIVVVVSAVRGVTDMILSITSEGIGTINSRSSKGNMAARHVREP